MNVASFLEFAYSLPTNRKYLIINFYVAVQNNMSKFYWEFCQQLLLLDRFILLDEVNEQLSATALLCLYHIVFSYLAAGKSFFGYCHTFLIVLVAAVLGLNISKLLCRLDHFFMQNVFSFSSWECFKLTLFGFYSTTGFLHYGMK